MARFDPLASSQIVVDPELGELPKNPLAARIAQLVAAGFTQEEAAKIAQEEMGLYGERGVAAGVAGSGEEADAAARAQRVRGLRQREAQQAAFEADYLPPDAPADMSDVDAILGRQMLPGGRYEKTGPMGPRQTSTPTDYGRRVPGPRSLSGAPVDPGQPFVSADEAASYDDRELTEDGAYKPSQKDQDMAARGMVPVFNPDGTVGYAVSAAPNTDTQIELPGAPGRAGRRPDLLAAGYAARTVQGPTGPQTVYIPDEAKKRQKDYKDRQQTKRQAVAAGVPLAEMAGKSDEERRAIVDAAGVKDAQARRAQWKAQAMLAGANPRKNLVNAWTMMDNIQQQEALRYMMPGGQLAAAVDAQNMANAADVVKRFMTSGAVSGVGVNPALQAAQAAAANAQARGADPVAAGTGDIAKGQYDTPEAQSELDRLAQSHDTSYGGFSYDNEASLSAALQNPPYNLSPAEADALAYKYGERRRWYWNQGQGARGKSPGKARPATGPATGAAPVEDAESPARPIPGRPIPPPPRNPLAAPRPFG